MFVHIPCLFDRSRYWPPHHCSVLLTSVSKQASWWVVCKPPVPQRAFTSLESTLCFFRHSLGRSLVCACHKDVLVNLLQRRHRSNKKRRNKQDNVLYLDKIETAKSTTFQLQCAISRWEGVRLGTTKSTPLGITSTLTCWGREPRWSLPCPSSPRPPHPKTTKRKRYTTLRKSGRTVVCWNVVLSERFLSA